MLIGWQTHSTSMANAIASVRCRRTFDVYGRRLHGVSPPDSPSDRPPDRPQIARDNRYAPKFGVVEHPRIWGDSTPPLSGSLDQCPHFVLALSPGTAPTRPRGQLRAGYSRRAHRKTHMIHIPNLTIDRDGDGPDVQVMLTQDFGGNEHMVSLHPSQVKVLAERMGILAPDADAQRTIARLSRQLRLLADRIDRMDTMLLGIGEKGRECVEEECAYSAASLELAQEFLADLHAVTSQPQADKTNAARQQRYRDRQAQRNAASVTTTVTGAPRNDTTQAERTTS